MKFETSTKFFTQLGKGKAPFYSVHILITNKQHGFLLYCRSPNKQAFPHINKEKNEKKLGRNFLNSTFLHKEYSVCLFSLLTYQAVLIAVCVSCRVYKQQVFFSDLVFVTLCLRVKAK